MPHPHREEYIYLPDVKDDTAIIAWGAFFFTEVSPGKWQLIPDDRLQHYETDRTNSIGLHSDSYGNAYVKYWERDSTHRVEHIEHAQGGHNHVELMELKPETVYAYEVYVNGALWATTPWDWDVKEQTLKDCGKTYINEFKTFPAAIQASPKCTFAVIGDYGVATGEEDDKGSCQYHVASLLEKEVTENNIRFVITTGDNIYTSSGLSTLVVNFLLGDEQHELGDTGKNDDDWFFTYFQPYRYIINRIPFFPSAGNHDTDETEDTEDFCQLLDNFYIRRRFRDNFEPRGFFTNKGLFYTFSYGKDLTFVALDTSKKVRGRSRKRYFHDADDFLRDVLSDAMSRESLWIIPFGHHPPHSIGPSHRGGDKHVYKELMHEYFPKAGVRVSFWGHEHNFQHWCLKWHARRNTGWEADDVDHHVFITGGGGKYDKWYGVGESDQKRFNPNSTARCFAWGQGGHFLLVDIYDNKKMLVKPVGVPDGVDKYSFSPEQAIGPGPRRSWLDRRTQFRIDPRPQGQ